MKRSPMKRGTTPMKRGKPMKAIGARAKRMRQGKVAPTREEKEWMDAAQAFGCIVCWLYYQSRVPAEIHHLKDGDRRKGHLFSIGLCMPHHRGGDDTGLYISRHPWLKRFEAAYGTEAYLLEQLQDMLPLLLLPQKNSLIDATQHSLEGIT